jgi:protein O-mannosyl-transferase
MIATTRDRTAWIAASLAGLVFAVWLPSLGASFQFDDWSVVVDDPRVQSVAAWWQSMPGMRALLKLSFALNHEWHAGAAGFRLVNIALHAGNTLLVFILLRRLGCQLSLDTRAAAFAATVAALVFALHPVQTESVTYIAGRSNALMASFSLLSLLAWSRRDGTHSWGSVLLCLLLVTAAMAAKETAAVLPFAFLLWSLVTRNARAGKLLPALLPAFAWVILLLAIGLAWLPYAHLLSTSLAERGVLSNLAVQAQAISWLAGQLLPFAQLNADPALAFDPAPTILTLAQVALHGGLILLAAFKLRRRPAIAFGILWFYLWLAPTNSLLARLDAANDRQLYLAIIGPGWLLGMGLAWAARRLTVKRAGRLAAVVILALLLGTGTLLRNRVYQDERSFWRDVAAKSPHSARAANNLGMAYALACEPAAAYREFKRAATIDPRDPRPAINAELMSMGELPGQPQVPGCRP